MRLGLARAAAQHQGLPFSEHGDPPPSNEAKPFQLSVKAAPGLTIDVGDAKNKQGFDCFKLDDSVYDSNNMHLRDAGPVAVRARLLQGLGWRVRRILPQELAKLVRPPPPPIVTPVQNAAGLNTEFNPAAFRPRPPIGAAGLPPSMGEFNPAAFAPRPGGAAGLPLPEFNPSGPPPAPIATTIAPHCA